MSARGPQAPGTAERPPLFGALAGSFLAMIAVDFLLHAVLLSHWWRATATSWRPPGELFAYIPYGYASFVLYAAGLNWLLIRLAGKRPPLQAAALIGLAAGAFIGGASILATYSVAPLPRSALLVFPVSFAAVLAAGATAAALVLAAARPRRRLALIAATAFAVFVLGVILQNVLFPTPANQRRSAPITQEKEWPMKAYTRDIVMAMSGLCPCSGRLSSAAGESSRVRLYPCGAPFSVDGDLLDEPARAIASTANAVVSSSDP